MTDPGTGEFGCSMETLEAPRAGWRRLDPNPSRHCRERNKLAPSDVLPNSTRRKRLRVKLNCVSQQVLQERPAINEGRARFHVVFDANSTCRLGLRLPKASQRLK